MVDGYVISRNYLPGADWVKNGEGVEQLRCKYEDCGHIWKPRLEPECCPFCKRYLAKTPPKPPIRYTSEQMLRRLREEREKVGLPPEG